MNIKIRQLIDQCTTTSQEYVDGRGNVTFTYFDKEKFAKLIIEECATQLCCGKFKDSSNENKIMIGQAVILNHFGIE